MNATNPQADDDPRGYRDALRARLLAAREAIAPAEHARMSQDIENHLERLLSQRRIGTLGFCWPFRGEFDARPLAARRIAAGATAALPVVTGKDAPLAFRRWTAESEMIVDRYGIHIPAAGAPLVPDAILMPVIAFDDAGFRLGYGGGYFDRTLAALAPRPLAIGVGFECLRVDTIRPQPHDLPMDWLVTEAGARQPRNIR